MSSPRECVLLVGGHGTRMHPFTHTRPKHLMPVGGIPLLDLQLERLAEQGARRVCVATARHTDQIAAHLDSTSTQLRDWGLDVVVSDEGRPLGTGGAILAAVDVLSPGADAAVAVLNGDLLTAHDMAAQSALLGPAADVVLHVRAALDPQPFGTVDLDKDGHTVVGFREKVSGPPGTLVNGGTYVVRPRVLSRWPRGVELSWERKILPELIDMGARVQAYNENAWFADIGSPAALLDATGAALAGEAAQALPTTYDPATAVGTHCNTGPGAVISGSTVGAGSMVDADAHIARSILLDGVHVGARARVVDSVIGEGARIGADAHLHGCSVGDGAMVDAGSVHETGSILTMGDDG